LKGSQSEGRVGDYELDLCEASPVNELVFIFLPSSPGSLNYSIRNQRLWPLGPCSVLSIWW